VHFCVVFKQYIISFFAGIGNLLHTLFFIFDGEKDHSGSTSDAQKLQSDWRKLYGDFADAKIKFKELHGS
jgi:hypothetical protein